MDRKKIYSQEYQDKCSVSFVPFYDIFFILFLNISNIFDIYYPDYSLQKCVQMEAYFKLSFSLRMCRFGGNS
jgi:hypothetical protein